MNRKSNFFGFSNSYISNAVSEIGEELYKLQQDVINIIVNEINEITIGEVFTLQPEEEANVISMKNEKEVTLFFYIPKGEKGDVGEKGETGEIGETGDTGEKGDKGEKGESLVWKGNWTSGISFQKNDIVSYQGSSYICTSTTQTIPTNTNNWDLITAKGQQGEKGDRGDTGDTGSKGDKGSKGDTGDTGPKGDTGSQGDSTLATAAASVAAAEAGIATVAATTAATAAGNAATAATAAANSALAANQTVSQFTAEYGPTIDNLERITQYQNTYPNVTNFSSSLEVNGNTVVSGSLDVDGRTSIGTSIGNIKVNGSNVQINALTIELNGLVTGFNFSGYFDQFS